MWILWPDAVIQSLQIVSFDCIQKDICCVSSRFVRILLFNKCSSLYMVDASDGSSTLRSIVLAQ